MKNKSKPLILLILGLLSIGVLRAQSTTLSSGSKAVGSGGSVSYSIGNINFSSATGSSGSLSQGIQYAYEFSTLGAKETRYGISLHVFPNPTAENITLLIKNYQREKLYYELYNSQGVLLNKEWVTVQQTLIPTYSIPIGVYFLLIFNQEKQKIQSFKILKNNL